MKKDMLKRSNGKHRRIIFSDEKLFSIEQNPEAEKRKSVVWAVISRKGKSRLVFIEEGVKIDRVVYMDILEEDLILWANDLFGEEQWYFQQNGAPSHKAIKTQAFLRENCPDFISIDTHWLRADGEWPPNSLDLNPLDYSIWSILEAKACAKPHKTIESLKRALIKAWNEITLEQLASIIDNFPKRLKACVEAKGGHFE
uniref:Transposase n=1 Tax=Acrobeloides nanus TaxID=290746 RepID=A0A914E5B1_9BILA